MSKTILIIDDDEDDLEIFCEAVEQSGLDYDCIKAIGGVDGLIVLENATVLPDYIFLDLNMPVMSGRECLVEIRRRYKDVPIIIFTTSNFILDKAGLMGDGATKFATKPNRFSDYVNVIKGVMELN